jgi:hypothetical protein
MKSTLRLCLLVMGTLAGLLAARPAQAVSFVNPYGDEAVHIQVGTWQEGHLGIVSFRRLRDNHCTWFTVGIPRIQSPISIFGSSQRDFIDIVAWIQPVTCSNRAPATFEAPVQAPGMVIFAVGMGGSDIMNCGGGFGGGASNVCSGGSGDDLMFNYGGNNTLFGGTGNDTLWSNSAGLLFGEDGDDCLQGVTGRLDFAPNVADCGPGNDRMSGLVTPATGCEVTVNSCL